MHVAVTGATGFLGGALSRRLLRDGHQVTALGRDRAKLETLQREGASVVVADLASGHPEPIGCDAFVHCAALAAPWGSAAAFEAANVEGTRTALTMAESGGAKRFVYISTPSVYFRFADQVGVREDDKLPKPVNAYARTKRTGEELALSAVRLDPIVLRPRGLYGAGDTALLPRVLKVARRRALPLLNDGRAATDLTHIDDVVEACIAAINAKATSRRVFNVSGGVALNVRDVAEAAGKRAGVPIRWRRVPAALALAYARTSEAICGLLPGKPEPAVTAYGAALFAYTQTLNISAAREELGWTPRISFAEGLDLTFVGAPA